MRQYFNSGGINTYINPVANDGVLLYAENVVTHPYGAKTKRPGYSPRSNNSPGTAPVNNLWAYNLDEDIYYIFATSGSVIKQLEGVGTDWTIPANGTISNNARVGVAYLHTTMIIGDGSGSTRHTTNGTSFTNTSLAPIANKFEQYQNRIFAMNNTDVFYSTTNDATNWNTSGTSDSSSIKVPGGGVNTSIMKVRDQLTFSKSTGAMHKWDGYSLIDMATQMGPTSRFSVGKIEDVAFYINANGHYSYASSKPQLLSSAVQDQFYDADGGGINPSYLGSVPAVCHRYEYIAHLGTITDRFTGKTMNNCLLRYDYLKNEYLNWNLSGTIIPRSFLSLTDTQANSDRQALLFGGSDGQVYQFRSTDLTDNGNPIKSELIFMFNYGAPELDKKWGSIRLFFNPGCEAKVQYALINNFDVKSVNWVDLGNARSGVLEVRFPTSSRSKFMMLHITDVSSSNRFTYYGCSIDAELIKNI